MSKTTAPPLDDLEAACLAAQGLDLPAIAARYEVTPDQARGAIARGRLEIAARNRPTAPTTTARPASPSGIPVRPRTLDPVQRDTFGIDDQFELEDMPQDTPPVAVPAQPPAPPREPACVPRAAAVDQLTLHGLLLWSDQHGTPKARLLADRIRAGETELRSLHARISQTAEARAAVAAANLQLAEAKARLRALEGGKDPAPAAPATTPEPADPAPNAASAAAVRIWARANGHDVPERGRIPNGLAAAHHAAHEPPGTS